MDTFLSYSSADKKLAESLRARLQQEGLSVGSPADASNRTDLQHSIKDAIRSARHILVLIGNRSADDRLQQLTWQLALQAVWQDPRKRLIPIRLGDAPLPAFVQSLQAITISPRSLDRAVGSILAAVGNRQAFVDRLRSDEIAEDLGTLRTRGGPSISFSASTDEASEQRRHRLEEIRQFAELLRP